MSVTAKNLEKLDKKVADAIHMSKPTADHVMVVRDPNGRWIFEIYTDGHAVERL